MSSEASTHPGDAPLHLDRLPSWDVYTLEVEATERQRLGCLPSNALRGALGHEARRRGDDVVPRLLENGAPGSGLESATTGGPAAIVLSGPFDPRGHNLERGDTLRFSAALVGEARSQAPTVIAMSRSALERGLGLGSGPGRPALRLVRCVKRSSLPARLGRRCLVAFETPLLVRHAGREVVQPPIEVVWSALLRRADGLARAYGGGPICPRRRDVEPGFRGGWTTTEAQSVNRTSARQGRSMRWRGTTGVLDLEILDPPRVEPLLHVATDLGVGRGTAMGCGRVGVVPMD